MFAHIGWGALSPSKTKKISEEFGASLESFHIHFIKFSSSQHLQLEDISALLEYGFPSNRPICGTLVPLKESRAQFSDFDNVIFVLPRVGTQSPWASKASDIFRICGVPVSKLEKGLVYCLNGPKLNVSDSRLNLLFDKMTQIVIVNSSLDQEVYFPSELQPLPLLTVPLKSSANPLETLKDANSKWGLALDNDEMEYLVSAFDDHNPTDAELMMFGQVNSEHCRHKIFNADWVVDGKNLDLSLFKMIKNTFNKSKKNILSAYSDNAAVLNGHVVKKFFSGEDRKYSFVTEEAPMLCKVETHNHPTAVSPFSGASTGSGGEIRDEGAVGIGSKPKCGLSGFTVSNLFIPGFVQPWETAPGFEGNLAYDVVHPGHIASPLKIMIEGPLGSSAFNNEFGRPSLCGYFRTFLSHNHGDEWLGYHKPIMIAGGMGNVRPFHVHKKELDVGDIVIVLGGPSMLIGLGGGAASSMTSGSSSKDLDFASVQRENPEMQRRCQEVIDRCCSLGECSPIKSIHDVGAGGLSNAVPEIVHDSGKGLQLDIRKVPCADPSLSPMQIWCNESQERYILVIDKRNLQLFEKICTRERCPFAAIGTVTELEFVTVVDSLLGSNVVSMSMEKLFRNPPKMIRKDESKQKNVSENMLYHLKEENIINYLDLVLCLPCVTSKSFLITIGDRSVTGLVARDQMVGRFQVPVSDVAVVASSYESLKGEAMAMGERTPLSIINSAASARMAVAESIMNICASYSGCHDSLENIRLSANWMACAKEKGEGSDLYEAVKAIGMELCPRLGLTIPVGKDSMSMKSQFKIKNHDNPVTVKSPVSLIVTAYTQVEDITKTLTPELKYVKDSVIILFDLGQGMNRLGKSALSQVLGLTGWTSPDLDNPELLKSFYVSMQKIRLDNRLVLAYHDRSDGGLLTTLLEMCFASRLGLELEIKNQSYIDFLFNEELGAVIQIKKENVYEVVELFKSNNFPPEHIHIIGNVVESDNILINGNIIIPRKHAFQKWIETSYRIQAIRDNEILAKQEFEINCREGNENELSYDLTFDLNVNFPLSNKKCRVAILREQGVNGQSEMAISFHRAGFEVLDVHMSDILDGLSLESFNGIALCGGFSYGDVLGAGRGWANSILMNRKSKMEFKKFFQRSDTFTIGVCNGCQTMSKLKNLIEEAYLEAGKEQLCGSKYWPDFEKNESDQFEARLCMVELVNTEKNLVSDMWFKDMIGSKLPIVVSHGEGRAVFKNHTINPDTVVMKYTASCYPGNPNGSPEGVTGFSTIDGRMLIMMPHPERVTRTPNLSWYPINETGLATKWKEDPYDDFRPSPWFQMFVNIRRWVEINK